MGFDEINNIAVFRMEDSGNRGYTGSIQRYSATLGDLIPMEQHDDIITFPEVWAVGYNGNKNAGPVEGPIYEECFSGFYESLDSREKALLDIRLGNVSRNYLRSTFVI